jgi:hypothetical protein
MPVAQPAVASAMQPAVPASWVSPPVVASRAKEATELPKKAPA